MHACLDVALDERSYPIFIGQNILSQASLWTPYIRGKQVLVVTNETVAPLYLQTVLGCLEGYQADSVILPDGESFKNMETLQLIFDGLLEKKHNRTTTLIALGGGVIGDMTGFAAACYQRGVDFIQIPTTLLSQVDSSVGGKTGVNHPAGKNMIGAFHQPRCVVIDTDSLNTLPDNELSAGLAEVIKYGLILDEDFLLWLEASMPQLRDRNPVTLAKAIYRCCEIKAEVVAEDEKESGIRALLNLGHTFGHAIETFAGYGEWLHGEAVGAGMMLAAMLSAKEGWITVDAFTRTAAVIESAGLPLLPPESMTTEDFLELMAVDKKVIDGQLRLVLLKAIGEAVVTAEFSPDNLVAILNEATA